MRLLATIILTAFFSPIAVGGISGVLLNDTSETYPTRELAAKYYHAVLETDHDLVQQRDTFRNVHVDDYAQRRLKVLDCGLNSKVLKLRTLGPDKLGSSKHSAYIKSRAMTANSILVGSSEYLENEFDFKATKNLNRKGFFVGALSGCRYSPLYAACDAWGVSHIKSALDEAEEELAATKRETDKAIEEGYCSAVSSFDEQLELVGEQ